MVRNRICAAAALAAMGFVLAAAALAGAQPHGIAPGDYFRIRVIDAATSRGVPLARVTTLAGVSRLTDNAGLIAYHEPGWMNRDTFFFVESPGYEFPADGFGNAGRALDARAGGEAVLALRRRYPAQRLYRVTGAGLWLDSVLLGVAPPIRHPLNNAGVVGQDSVHTAIYRGRLFWLWGDTTHIRYPLAANFKVTCATSLLPAQGGLDPETGVDLEYFTDPATGFVKPMAPLPGAGNPCWLTALAAVRDASGRERLVAAYAKIQPPMETAGRGLVEFHDEKEVFEEIRQDPLDTPLRPDGHAFPVTLDGVDYLYFLGAGLTRVRAAYEAYVDPAAWEAYTCLREGEAFAAEAARRDLGPDGRPRFGWKRGAAAIGAEEQEQLVKAGLLRPEERWMRLRDADTGAEVRYHGGSIAWNEYRRRWVLICTQLFGDVSMLGEVWFAESERPEGPWIEARRVATHPNYSYYNPMQHPYFAKEGGRVIFFEGTYTRTFSGAPAPEPRYEYNQLLYKLDLNDLFPPDPE